MEKYFNKTEAPVSESEPAKSHRDLISDLLGEIAQINKLEVEAKNDVVTIAVDKKGKHWTCPFGDKGCVEVAESDLSARAKEEAGAKPVDYLD